MRQDHKEAGGRLWTRPFVLVCLICLLTGFSMNMLNSTMAKYIYSIYGNASFSGLLNVSFAVLAITGRLLAGTLSDRYGRRPLIITGCVIFAVSALCFGIFPWAAVLILFRGLQGLGYSAATTADYAAGADVIPYHRMSEGIGYIGLGYCLAMAIGPALAMGLIIGESYQPMFLAAALMAVLGAVCAILNRYENAPCALKPDMQRRRPSVHRTTGIFRLIEPKALPATLTQFFNCMAFAAVNSFIVIYAEAQGIAHVSLFFTCMAVAMCLTRLFSGKLTDRVGATVVIVPSILLSIAGFILLLAVHSGPIFYFVGFLMGFASGTANPVLQALAIKASPVSRRGTANGTFQLSNDIANGLGALLWGVVIDCSGYPAMFLGCIAFSLFAVLCPLTVFRKQFAAPDTRAGDP